MLVFVFVTSWISYNFLYKAKPVWHVERKILVKYSVKWNICFQSDIVRSLKTRRQSLPENVFATFWVIYLHVLEIMHENITKTIRIMQHVVLMLPCWNCRQLQLLLNFMKRVSANRVLEISRDLLNKDLVCYFYCFLYFWLVFLCVW